MYEQDLRPTVIERFFYLTVEYIQAREGIAQEDALWSIAFKILLGEIQEAREAHQVDNNRETLIEIIDVLLPAIFHLMGWSASHVVKISTSNSSATIYDANLEKSLDHVLQLILDAQGLQGLRSEEAMVVINQLVYILLNNFPPDAILVAFRDKFYKDTQNYPAVLFQHSVTDREKQLYRQLYPDLDDTMVLSLRHYYRIKVLKLIRHVAKKIFNGDEYVVNIDTDILNIFGLVFTEYGIDDQALHRAYYLLTALKHLIDTRTQIRQIHNGEIRKLLRDVQEEIDQRLVQRAVNEEYPIASLPIRVFRGIVNRVIDENLQEIMNYEDRDGFWKGVEEDYIVLISSSLHNFAQVEKLGQLFIS